MNNAQLVSIFQDLTDLNCYLHRAFRIKPSLPTKRLGQRDPFDVLHHNEVPAVRKIAGVKNYRGVRVTKAGHGPRFTHEAICEIAVIGIFGFYYFYRDRALQAEVGRTIDCAHASPADLAFDAKPAGNELRDIHDGPSFGIKVARTDGLKREGEQTLSRAPQPLFCLR